MNRRLNLVFLAVLLTVVVVLGGGMHLVHGYQVQRNASSLLDRARRAEDDKDVLKAEQVLSQYLKLRPKDGSAWEWYARLADERDPIHRRPERVFLIHEEALRHRPGDPKLERRLRNIALALRRYTDAQRHLRNLQETVAKTSTGQPAAAELAELLDLQGQCDRGLARYDDAEKKFGDAIERDPARVACYDRLARLLRIELRRIEDADRTIKRMVANNPTSARAYIYRWRYSREFLPSAEAWDVKIAHGLAPDDPEVLFAAAVVSEEKDDSASARACYKKGFELDPKNAAFAMGLVRLETQEKHLDRAEDVLRQAYQANPSVELTYSLAELLIGEGKIEGAGQANEYIGRLRDLGYGETLVLALEADILVQRKKWAEAIPRFETARAVLRSDPRFTGPLNLKLAECYGHVGDEAKRLIALRQAAEAGQGSEPIRVELARSLARTGQLEQAVTTLLSSTARTPDWRLELVRLLIQKTICQPLEQQNWPEVNRQLKEAEKALPRAVEPLLLLRLDMLAAQNRLNDARSLLTTALVKDPGSVRYRLALARLTQRQGQGAAALRMLDQTEKELGPSLDLRLARLDYWGFERGAEAKSVVAKLAATREQVPAAGRPAFLDRLAAVEIQLGEPELARQHLGELARLRPNDVEVFLNLFDLALQSADHVHALELITKIREIEGERGIFWRYEQARYLLDQVSRGATKDRKDAPALAAELAAERPDWWGGPVLLAEMADADGQTEEAIKYYREAIELGNTRPGPARRLVGLLSQKNDSKEIDRVITTLSNRGMAVGDLTIASAFNAIRNQDYDRGIALARQVLSERSTVFADHLALAQFYLAARRPIEARKRLERAVELAPGVPVTWLSYVRYLVMEKKVDEAKAAIERARKMIPADRANLALAQCFWLVGNTAEAETMIQAALRSPACDLATIRVAVELYMNHGQLDRVEPTLDKLNAKTIKTTPEILAWANRTRVVARLGTGRPAEIDRALGLIDENLKANPASSDDLKLKGILLSTRASRRAEAIEILERFDQANRLGTDDQFVLAQTYLAARLVDKYRSEMEKILRAAVKNPRHLIHFIDFLIGARQLDLADHWLVELKRAAPQSLLLLEREARLLDLRKRRPELLDRLQARSRQVPGEIGAVATLLDRFGFAKEAEEAYKAYVVRNPNEPERVLVLASFLVRQNRIKEAGAILEKAWSNCRPEAVAWTALALFEAPSVDETLRRQVEAWVAEAIRKSPVAASRLRPKLATIRLFQGKYDEAEALSREILASDPDAVESLNTLAWVLSLRKLGEPRKALELIDRAIEKAGLLSSLVDTRAVALIRAGEPARAAEELRVAREADPDNVSLSLHLAWANQEVGKITEARKAFQRAEELGLRPGTRDPLERSIIDGLRKRLTTDQPIPSSGG